MTGITDTFLQESLHICSEITFEDMIVSTVQLRSQPIWFNSLIPIENKLVYFKLWATNGIQTISDLATNDGTFVPSRISKNVTKLSQRFYLLWVLFQR